VRELCTNFGEIACMWFDGDWPHYKLDETTAYFAAGGSFEYEKLYDMIHTLQPQAVVINNRHEKPLPGEDIQGFEQDLPGMNSAGFNTTAIYDLPLEVCMTLNDCWGYHQGDHNHKSARHLVHMLARSASVGGNYLLNVGPTPEGEILEVHARRLRQVGAWLKLNGGSVYDTQAGSIPSTRATVSTRRDDTHYIHILDYISDCVSLEAVPETVTHARLLRDGIPLHMERRDGKTLITIPYDVYDPFDTVIELRSE
jgi:alpha-L-fucosidase